VVEAMATTGARVRAVRVRQGVSLGALAAATGLSKSYLSRAERGERGLDRRGVLESIADALRVPLAELTGQPYQPRSPAETAAQAAALDVRDALMGTELGEEPMGPVRPVEQVERELWRVERLAEASNYAGFGPLLPQLIVDAHAAAAGGPDGLVQLMRCCFMVGRLCKGTGHYELGWIAADRAHRAAMRSGDPVLVGAADVLRGFLMVSAGVRPRDRALAVTTRSAEQLTRQPLSVDGAEVLGMLHLVGAFAHAAAGGFAAADERLAEAGELAAHTGDGNAWGLWFGPTNVGAWRVAIAVERGGAGAVAELAEAVDDGLLPPFRRASMLADVGRALARERGRQDDAVEAFLRAEMIAPHQLHADPYAREAVASLLAAAGGQRLRGLARRVGVLAA
jgi:transcriptional regulator with XRE-family HTH domain